MILWPCTEEIFTILPAPFDSMEGSTVLATVQAAFRSSSRQRSHSESGSSSGAANTLAPALLINTSIRPKRSSVEATAAATCEGRLTSAVTSSMPPALRRTHYPPPPPTHPLLSATEPAHPQPPHP